MADKANAPSTAPRVDPPKAPSLNSLTGLAALLQGTMERTDVCKGGTRTLLSANMPAMSFRRIGTCHSGIVPRFGD